MKRLFIGLIALIMTTAVSAQNYSYFDNDVRFTNDGNPIVTLTHFGVFPITEKFGFTDYASVEGDNLYGYGQVLLGGYYNITDNLSVYLLAGKESISNQARFAGVLYYTTGDAVRAYAFYQRNENPFSGDTINSEWYDFMLRLAMTSKEKNSSYIGARYIKYYGLGVPISFRQSLSPTSNLYIGYTHYYDVDDNYSGDWTPTLTLAIEFL